jgi:hypothetical protein
MLRLGSRARLLKPAALRRAVLERVEAVRALYAD